MKEKLKNFWQDNKYTVLGYTAVVTGCLWLGYFSAYLYAKGIVFGVTNTMEFVQQIFEKFPQAADELNAIAKEQGTVSYEEFGKIFETYGNQLNELLETTNG